MKPLLQKLPLTDNMSFVAKTFRTPEFEVGWHQHPEYELILFTEGSGLSFIGNHVGEFSTQDIYFLGSNLPHTFRKSGEQVTSAIVVQFREDIFGSSFLQLPELGAIRELLRHSGRGLKIQGSLREKLIPLINHMEGASGMDRVLALLTSLHTMAETQEFRPLCIQEGLYPSTTDHRIDLVFQYTIDHFHERIGLDQVAGLVHLSVPAFCHFFKRSTKKTYIDFLNEVRISYACRLLSGTDRSITTICFETGYNSVSHFHKMFFGLKGLTPLQYRKKLAPDRPITLYPLPSTLL